MRDLKPEHLTTRKLRTMAKDSDSETLLKLQERLTAIIGEKLEEEHERAEEEQRRNEAVKEIMSLVQEQGLTLEDLVASQGGTVTKRGRKARKPQSLADNNDANGVEDDLAASEQNEGAH